MADHRERDSYYSQTDLRSKNDDPPNSRLFVICHKSLEEDDLRKAFEKFGKIEDIWVVKDRITGENKGNSSCLQKKSIKFYFIFLYFWKIFKFTYIIFIYENCLFVCFLYHHLNILKVIHIVYVGVTYIKFSKTSEAAFALEEMNGKMLGSVGRPIKVMIASK